MTVFYEWDCETISDGDTDDFENGEVIDHSHGESYKAIVKWSETYPPNKGEKHQFVLVRDDDEGRSWAYVEDGKLPEYFTDAYYVKTAKVPKKFHMEISK